MAFCGSCDSVFFVVKCNMFHPEIRLCFHQILCHSKWMCVLWTICLILQLKSNRLDWQQLIVGLGYELDKSIGYRSVPSSLRILIKFIKWVYSWTKKYSAEFRWYNSLKLFALLFCSLQLVFLFFCLDCWFGQHLCRSQFQRKRGETSLRPYFLLWLQYFSKVFQLTTIWG